MKQFLATFLICTFFINSSVCFAQISDPVIDAQRAECVKNSAREWSVQSNRCVDKIETGTYRKDSVEKCKDKKTIEEKKNCELQLATEKSGVTSNAEEAMGKIQSATSQSALVNGATTILSVISMLGSSGGPGNSCMSKNILSITSIGGTITDILMKIKMKNKLEELQQKYQLTLKDNSYQAQYKALQYLKEEQEMVKDIADMEAKRQTLLMVGYAATLATALYETFYNSTCYKPKAEPATIKPVPAAVPAAPVAAPVAPVATAPVAVVDPPVPQVVAPVQKIEPLAAIPDTEIKVPEISNQTAVLDNTPVVVDSAPLTMENRVASCPPNCQTNEVKMASGKIAYQELDASGNVVGISMARYDKSIDPATGQKVGWVKDIYTPTSSSINVTTGRGPILGTIPMQPATRIDAWVKPTPVYRPLRSGGG